MLLYFQFHFIPQNVKVCPNTTSKFIYQNRLKLQRINITVVELFRETYSCLIKVSKFNINVIISNRMRRMHIIIRQNKSSK